MSQQRLEAKKLENLKRVFYMQCARVSFDSEYCNKHNCTRVMIAKNARNQEIFRVQTTYTRNGFFPKPNEHRYSVGYIIIKSGKVIADVTLKDTDAEYLTDFPERELYMLLIRKRIRQQEAAECLGNAFIKALRDNQRLRTK